MRFTGRPLRRQRRLTCEIPTLAAAKVQNEREPPVPLKPGLFASRSRHPPLPAATSSRKRHGRVQPQAALQSYLALLFTALLITFRTAKFRAANRSIDRQVLDLSPLASVSHVRQADPSLHIFTVPKPFVGPDATHQLRAIESWLALTPRPTVTLIGNGEGIRDTAQRYSLAHEANVDTTFLSLPLLPSILSIANRSQSDISVLLNADILLYDDASLAFRKLYLDFGARPWLAIAARWDVPALKSPMLRGAFKRPSESARRALVADARLSGVLHTYGGVDVWAWRTGKAPLAHAYVPSFVFGRGRYDNWLTHQAIAEGSHSVIDISQSITAVHVHHDHHLVMRTADAAADAKTGQSEFWSTGAHHMFEIVMNAHLASRYGTYSSQAGTVLHAPLKLSSCYEPQAHCLFERTRPHACRCEHSAYVHHAQNDPYVVRGSNVVFCGLLRVNEGEHDDIERHRWAVSGRVNDDREGSRADRDEAFGLPLTRSDVLSIIGNRTGSSNVILLAAEHGDRHLVAETVCSMRAAGVFSSLVLCALDDDMYRYSATRGFATYLAEFEDGGFSDHANFRELARLQAVLEVLRSGRNVLSVQPGALFQQSPWPYMDAELVGKDIGMMRASGKAGTNGNTPDFVPFVMLYARPTAATARILQKVMGMLEARHERRAGRVLVDVACGAGAGLDDGACVTDRATGDVHFFHAGLFSVLGGGGGDDRIVGFPTSLAVHEGSDDEALTEIRRHGLSRTNGDQEFCTW